MFKRILKKVIPIAISTALVASVLFVGTITANAAPVDSAGKLQVIGANLCDQSGKTIQLRGMSTHGLQYYPDVVNMNAFKTLRDDWKSNVVRLAMYTDEKGYISNPASMKQTLINGVDYAISLGMYVIIDWHILADGDPNTYKSQAVDFFKEMATKYGNTPNVIYEICNEPNKVNWSSIKSYAETVVPAIRAIDPDNIIIIGTPMWSQDCDIAASDPVNGINLMYACHFYAGTHGQYLRDKISSARSKGKAVFISEWGTSDSTGGSNGRVFLSQADEWMNFLNKDKISWCNWSLCTKNESSAAFKGGVSLNGNWSNSDLTESGAYVKTKLISLSQSDPMTTGNIITQSPTNTSSAGVKGDVNGDNKVTSTDSSILTRHVLGVSILSGNYFNLGDYNNDGRINSTDISLVERIVLGK